MGIQIWHVTYDEGEATRLNISTLRKQDHKTGSNNRASDPILARCVRSASDPNLPGATLR